jgi:hypothetical protein
MQHSIQLCEENCAHKQTHNEIITWSDKTLPIRVRSKVWHITTSWFPLLYYTISLERLTSSISAVHYFLLFFSWSHSTTCSDKFTATRAWLMLSGHAWHEKQKNKQTRGCVTLSPCHLHLIKSILSQKKKNYRNSNISPCKNIIFKKSSKRNPKCFKIPIITLF